jgi:hypothetical protein
MVDLQEAHARHAALVDKKFAAALSEEEQAEMLRLEAYLNEVEAELYEPVKNKLHAEKTREIPWAGLVHDPGMVSAERIDEELAKSWGDDLDRDRR